MAVLGYRIPYRVHSLPRLGAAGAFAGGLAVLVAIAAAGDAVVRTLGLPLPGSVAGMLALTAWLALRPQDTGPLSRSGDPLLRALPLLFVPLLVGASGAARHLGAALPAACAVIVLATGAAALAALAAARGTAWISRRSR